MISKTAGKYPQESYTAVVREIQSEWIFLQNFTWDTVDSFGGSGEDDLRNLFASYFLWKDENHPPRHRSSKYDSRQEIRTGTPEFSDVCTGEVLNLHARYRRTDTGRDGGRGILQFRPPPDPKRGVT